MKFTSYILLLILFIPIGTQAFHSSETRERSTPLVLTMGQDTYPFQFIDEQGQPAGVMVDLWNEWANVTNQKVVFTAKHWGDSLKALESGTADVHIGMAINESRHEKFDFSNPISTLKSYLFIHKSVGNIHNIRELIPYHIGIVEGSAHESHLLALEPLLTLKYFKTREALLTAAAKNEIFVFAGIEGYQRNLPLEQDVAKNFHPSAKIAIQSFDISAAVLKGNIPLLDDINEGFKFVSPESIQQIERRWFGYHRQRAGMMIAMQTNAEPYSDLSVDGKPIGLLVDMWRLWSEKTGIDIDFVTGDMNSSLNDVKTNVADVHIGFPESNEMKSGLKQVRHMLSVKSRFFSLQSNLAAFDSSKALRVGVFPSSPYLAEIKRLFPKAQLRFYEDLSQMTAATQSNEISGFIASSAMTSHYLLKNKLWAEFNSLPDIEFNTDIFSLVRVNEVNLADRIAAGFDLISSEELLQLERKWLINANDRYFSQQEKRIKLSQNEQNYLSRLGALKMGYLAQWPPMEFQGRNGEFLGVNADIKNLLVQQLGISIIPVAYNDFESMMKDIVKGEIQIVASLSPTKDRKASLIFTAPYWPAPWAIATSIEQQPIFNLSQVNGKRLAVVDGYHIIAQLQQQYPGIELVLVANTQSGMKAMLSGEVDMFLDKVTILANSLKSGQYPSLKLSLLVDLAEDQSSIGLFPGVKELAPLINRTLQTIDESSQQKIYDKWVSLDVNADTSKYQRWLVILMVSSLILFCIVLSVVIINRRLKIEVKRREFAEQQLTFLATHDAVTQLPNRAHIDEKLLLAINQHHIDKTRFAILFIDLDNFKAVNDEHGHHVGDQLLISVAQRLSLLVSDTDIVGRFGGDEFIFILNQTTSTNDALQIVETIKQSLLKPIIIDGIKLVVSASIGVAIYPDDGKDSVTLLGKSDQLMYQAKRSGINPPR